MPLSDIQVRNLKSTDKAYKVSDFEGLFILVKVSGSKSWRFKYRIDGKEKLLVIGNYPAISLAQARKAKDAAKAQLAQGTDPNDSKQEEKRIRLATKGETFEKLGQAFLEKQRIEGKTKATLDKTAYHLKLANCDFGRRPITEITAPMILKTLRKVEAKGNYETAHRLRARIGSIFRYAVASGIAEMDPTYALRDALIRPTRKHRAAITDPNELGQLLRDIEQFNGQISTRIALKLLAMLAQRPGELRHAKWKEFDLEEGVWRIPAGKMKMRRDHSVPLPAQAIALLEELRPLTGECEYLFPSLNSWKRSMSENTLNAALRRMGYSGDEMTAHGFRASFSTLANESGLWNPDAIERALAHEERNEVRRAYDRGKHWEDSVIAWVRSPEMIGRRFMFPSRFHDRPHIATRQYGRLVRDWVKAIGLEPSGYGTHSVRRTKAAEIYRKKGNLRAVQLLLGDTKVDSTVRYLGVELEDALRIAERIDI